MGISISLRSIGEEKSSCLESEYEKKKEGKKE